MDLIFVHALWGHYRYSWSASLALADFWPREWLKRDPGFKHVRISSYGYNPTWTDDWEKKKKDSAAAQLGKKFVRHLQESQLIGGSTSVQATLTFRASLA